MRRRKATRTKEILLRKFYTMQPDCVAKASAWQDRGAKEAGRQHSHSGPMMNHVSSITVAPGKTAIFVWTCEGTTNLEFACDIPSHCEEARAARSLLFDRRSI